LILLYPCRSFVPLYSIALLPPHSMFAVVPSFLPHFMMATAFLPSLFYTGDCAVCAPAQVCVGFAHSFFTLLPFPLKPFRPSSPGKVSSAPSLGCVVRLVHPLFVSFDSVLLSFLLPLLFLPSSSSPNPQKTHTLTTPFPQIGEIIGRRSLVGYDVPLAQHH